MARALLPRIDSYGASHGGKVCKTNEDQFLIASLTKQLAVRQSSIPQHSVDAASNLHGQLFVVADGSGGCVDGKCASTLAVEALSTFVLKQMHWHLLDEETRENIILSEFQDAIQYCQNRFLRYRERHPEFREMGSTLTAAYLAWPNLYVVHTGNSRCYLFHENCLLQITADDVAIPAITRSARVPSSTALSAHHDLRSTYRGISQEGSQSPLSFLQLQTGDTVLLCSDGLTNHVSDERILAVLMSDRGAQEICEQLIEDSLAMGSEDNITVIAVSFPEPGEVTPWSEPPVRVTDGSASYRRSSDSGAPVNQQFGSECRTSAPPASISRDCVRSSK